MGEMGNPISGLFSRFL